MLLKLYLARKIEESKVSYFLNITSKSISQKKHHISTKNNGPMKVLICSGEFGMYPTE